MRITTLVENERVESRKDLDVEAGLSLHIELNGKQILFDTGIANAFSNNVKKLGIDLSSVAALVISHHHYDHGGGLPQFIQENQKAKIYLRQCEERSYYFKAFAGIIKKYVGLDWDFIHKHHDRFELADDFTQVLPKVFILTDIKREFSTPKGNRHLFAKKDGNEFQDKFDHELILVLKAAEGLVVLSGCSHNGILNMVGTVTKQFPNERIPALLGGFHMFDNPVFNTIAGTKEEVQETARKLLDYPVDRYYTGHCTGLKAFNIMKEVMKDRLEYLPTGKTIEIPG